MHNITYQLIMIEIWCYKQYLGHKLDKQIYRSRNVATCIIITTYCNNFTRMSMAKIYECSINGSWLPPFKSLHLKSIYQMKIFREDGMHLPEWNKEVWSSVWNNMIARDLKTHNHNIINCRNFNVQRVKSNKILSSVHIEQHKRQILVPI